MVARCDCRCGQRSAWWPVLRASIDGVSDCAPNPPPSSLNVLRPMKYLETDMWIDVIWICHNLFDRFRLHPQIGYRRITQGRSPRTWAAMPSLGFGNPTTLNDDAQEPASCWSQPVRIQRAIQCLLEFRAFRNPQRYASAADRAMIAAPQLPHIAPPFDGCRLARLNIRLSRPSGPCCFCELHLASPLFNATSSLSSLRRHPRSCLHLPHVLFWYSCLLPHCSRLASKWLFPWSLWMQRSSYILGGCIVVLHPFLEPEARHCSLLAARDSVSTSRYCRCFSSWVLPILAAASFPSLEDEHSDEFVATSLPSFTLRVLQGCRVTVRAAAFPAGSTSPHEVTSSSISNRNCFGSRSLQILRRSQPATSREIPL